jgi:hypothetical protein
MREMPLEAIVSISVQLPASKSAQNAAGDDRARECAVRVLKMLSAASVTATWIADNPAENTTLAQALAAGHEAGFRVVTVAAAHDNLRSGLVAEIIAGKSRAQQVGIAINTLALTDESDLPAQLVAKYGFKAVCALADTERRGGKNLGGPVALRFGLWQIPSNCRVSGGNLISDWRSSLRIRRTIDRAVRDRKSIHLEIDVAEIARRSSLERCGGLPSILRHIERRRDAAALQTFTVEQLVARLAPASLARSGGSILRAA